MKQRLKRIFLPSRTITALWSLLAFTAAFILLDNTGAVSPGPSLHAAIHMGIVCIALTLVSVQMATFHRQRKRMLRRLSEDEPSE